MSKFLKNNLLLLICSIGLFSAYAAQHAPQKDCHFTAPDGRKVTIKNMERAGVLLIRDHGTSGVSGLVVILGQDRAGTLMPFSGSCESTDRTAAQTAARELHEETGGLLSIPEEILEASPAVNTRTKVLYIVKGGFSEDSITDSCRRALANPGLSHAYKEMEAACAISLQELKRVYPQLNAGDFTPVEVRTVKGERKIIDGWYKGPMARFVDFANKHYF